jgi:hypothetical protein
VTVVLSVGVPALSGVDLHQRFGETGRRIRLAGANKLYKCGVQGHLYREDTAMASAAGRALWSAGGLAYRAQFFWDGQAFNQIDGREAGVVHRDRWLCVKVVPQPRARVESAGVTAGRFTGRNLVGDGYGSGETISAWLLSLPSLPSEFEPMVAALDSSRPGRWAASRGGERPLRASSGNR